MDDCLFYQNHEENLFVSFASLKFYRNNLYDMFIGIKRNGKPRFATHTLPGQLATQFVVLPIVVASQTQGFLWVTAPL